MEEIKLEFSSQQFNDLILALDIVQDCYKDTENKFKADIYANLLTSVLIQKAFQDYSLIQSRAAINLKK